MTYHLNDSKICNFLNDFKSLVYLCRNYVVNPKNIVVIAGHTYVIDFIQIPVCVVDSNGTIREKTGKIYQRIIPTEPDNNPAYVIKKRLTLDSADFFYYHPAIPFDLKKTDCPCKEWLSWEFVQIPDETCTNGEMVKLIRIKEGTNLKEIDVATTKLCLIIKCNFESKSDKNWNNWLVLGKKDADLVITTISPEKTKNDNKLTTTAHSDKSKSSGEKNNCLFVENGGKTRENVTGGAEAMGMTRYNSDDDVDRRIEELERKARRKQVESSTNQIEKRSTPITNVNDNNFFMLRKIKKERIDKGDNNSSSGDDRTTIGWSESQYIEDKNRIDHLRLM